MPNFDAITFLMIDSQPISLGQAFGYLQLFGRLQPFVQECLRYHAIYQEIQSRENLRVTSAELAQAVIDFRLRTELTDQERFQQWLASQGIDYTIFENQVLIGLKLEKLKDRIVEAELPTYFEQQRHTLDQVDLYYIIAAEEALAQQIRGQIKAGKSFEQIAREHPLTPEQKVLVKRDVLRRERIREEIKTAVETAPPKELIGPIVMGNRWCLFQVEQVLPAVLDEPVKQELREVLFNQWLAMRLQQMAVEPADSQPTDSLDTTESELVGVFPNS
jgi:parvulin-like peptidyl-prolyl isomerase